MSSKVKKFFGGLPLLKISIKPRKTHIQELLEDKVVLDLLYLAFYRGVSWTLIKNDFDRAAVL